MPRIYVKFSGLSQIGADCKEISSKVDTIQSEFQNIIRQLDWDIRFESNINSTANQISKKLEQYSSALETYQWFIDDAHSEYIKLDKFQRKPILDNWIIGSIKPIDIHILGPGDNPFANRELILSEKIKEYFSNIEEEKDLLSTVKTLLNGADKFGDEDEADILKDAISYIQNFSSFFNGDKKGLTGASDGIGNKQWQSAVANYIDCGKDLLSVISSGYSLKHIGDVKSLTEMKAGP